MIHQIYQKLPFSAISGIFIEGYILYSPCGLELISKSINSVITNKGFTAISLSDVDCVDRYRVDFLNLIKSNEINLIFGNKMEMMSLLKVKSEIDLIKRMKELSGFVERLVMTSGKMAHYPSKRVNLLMPQQKMWKIA